MAAAALVWLWPGAPASGDAESVPVQVIGPGGAMLFDGEVAQPGTAYGALVKAGVAGAFAIEARGQGCGTYVASVAGHREGGSDGWLYWVHRDGAWSKPAVSSGCFALEAGDKVLWSWSANAAPDA